MPAGKEYVVGRPLSPCGCAGGMASEITTQMGQCPWILNPPEWFWAFAVYYLLNILPCLEPTAVDFFFFVG